MTTPASGPEGEPGGGPPGDGPGGGPAGGPADDLEADRQLLRAAVEAAGAMALSYFRRDPKRWQKGPGQVVTEADIAIDDLLRQCLLDARPGDGWLSEERSDDGSRTRRRRVWVVDPIDGTRAFVDGLPEFTISAALVVAGRPLLGVVLNPATGEWFEAARGAGARYNGAAMQVSPKTNLEAAHLLSSRTELRRRNWSELISGPRFTPLSSLAYKLALIAAGRYDGLVSPRPCHDWDIAAALLLLKEAGGLITEADGGPVALNRPVPRQAGLVAAGTLGLHAALVAGLADHRG